MASSIHVDYERLASEYDDRYKIPAFTEPRGQALLALAAECGARDILEVGCGTGHWLDGLRASGARLNGLDYSPAMLQKAQARGLTLRLVRGSAVELPYASAIFDLVYCVDALHHFGDARKFLKEACRVLRPGGVLAIVGNDPHSGEVQWYGYEYFPGVRETDLARFTPYSRLTGWMAEIGFLDIRSEIIEGFNKPQCGRAIFSDPFLKKQASSQFALLSEADYRTGLQYIENAILAAEAQGREIIFEACWPVRLLRGRRS